MMSALIVPDFNIKKDEPEQGVKELIKKIKPAWDAEKLQLKSLAGGYSSKIFICCDGENPEDAVTIRLRDAVDSYEDSKNSKILELQAIQHLAKVGHFPKVYAIFANGYCYEYVQGKPMFNFKTKKGFVDDKMLKLIAKELVFIHNQRIDGIVYDKSRIFYIQSVVMSLPFTAVYPSAPNQQVAQNEINMVQKYLETQGSPITVMHGDMNPANIVWDDSKDKLTFVDWEGASVGYQFYDIAYFLIVLQMTDELFNKKERSFIFPEDLENKFLRYYFEAWMEDRKEEFTEEKLAHFKFEVQKYKMPALLFLLIMSLSLPDSITDFCGDNNLFLEFSLSNYLRIKKQIMGREEFDVPAGMSND